MVFSNRTKRTTRNSKLCHKPLKAHSFIVLKKKIVIHDQEKLLKIEYKEQGTVKSKAIEIEEYLKTEREKFEKAFAAEEQQEEEATEATEGEKKEGEKNEGEKKEGEKKEGEEKPVAKVEEEEPDFEKQ